MAKLLYEEERIRDIATKIKQFVPYLHIDRFTTKEMADSVDHVHEAGKARGRVEGYNLGVIRGKEEGYNAGYSKGETDGYTGGYTTGYATGKVDGAENLKRDEARTVTDLKFERLAQFDLGLTVPSGYYGVDAQKIIDLEPYYDEGFDAGRNAGYSEGRNVGYSEGFADGAASVSTYEDGNGVKY